MKRPTLSIVTIVVFVVLASMLIYPRLRRRLQRSLRSAAPVTVPGSARIEGPYFSADDRIVDRIVAAINHTNKSIHISMYDLTEAQITAALDAARRRGVDVRIVADEHQSHEPHSELSYLVSHGVQVRLSHGFRGNRSIMHDKFAVFDDGLIETGSFNWTTSADQFDFENAVFISDPAVASRYEDEFERIWEQAR